MQLSRLSHGRSLNNLTLSAIVWLSIYVGFNPRIEETQSAVWLHTNLVTVLYKYHPGYVDILTKSGPLTVSPIGRGCRVPHASGTEYVFTN